MAASHSERHPLDKALIERLHLKGDNPFSLRLIRGAMHATDAVFRGVSGQPFFALRESEEILTRLDGRQGHALIAALLSFHDGTVIDASGLEHIPPTGPVVIASTHPTGLFDFIAHASALHALRPDLKVVANQESRRYLGEDLIVPVKIDKQNRALSSAATQRGMLAHLRGGGALLIFGSGRVPHMKNGLLHEPGWKQGATKISGDAGASVIPAALKAKNTPAYYKVRSVAQFIAGGNDNFGAMISSLRYMAELLEKLGGRYEVCYGPPLPPGTPPGDLKVAAEALVPGLYLPGAK